MQEEQATASMETAGPVAGRPAGSAWDFLPAAWLALVLAAYGLLVLNPLPEGGAVPGIPELERLTLPLLCLFGVAAIIRYFSLRKGQPRHSPAEAAEGQDTV